ncbi:hypothetical protein BGZ46_002773 [Entomortierella lignicola]|nr:hypothetical protein BGZ46_002773 [Entomortierella lignicola]
MHYPLTEWENAITWPNILFRVLREHDNAEFGLSATNPGAGLTINEHVRKGTGNQIRSQYISVTQDLSTALRWVIGGRSSFAIIYPPLLDEGIEIMDLSEGSSELDNVGNRFAIKDSEALLHPYVNPEAIKDVFSFEDLQMINNEISDPYASDLLLNCMGFIMDLIESYDICFFENERNELLWIYGKDWNWEGEEEEEEEEEEEDGYDYEDDEYDNYSDEEFWYSESAEGWAPESVEDWAPESVKDWAPESVEGWAPESVEDWAPKSVEDWPALCASESLQDWASSSQQGRSYHSDSDPERLGVLFSSMKLQKNNYYSAIATIK